MNNQPETQLDDLKAVAQHLRADFNRDTKKPRYILLFAHNGTGKTRLSMTFKDIGKTQNNESADTLYYNAFTEDLFRWDNDLDHDENRVLQLNTQSRFFEGLESLEMETRIRTLLQRYSDFDFHIDTENWTVRFKRDVIKNGRSETVENIKISRGEENIFIWCFFLAIAEIAIDQDGTDQGGGLAYTWVRYIYIDDPISSLDDNNTIAIAAHLAQLLKKQTSVQTVISTHHTLFFNVMHNELKNKHHLKPYYLNAINDATQYTLRHTNDTPFFHHVALLQQLQQAADTGALYTYHFNILRNILEKTATFHGFNNFSACITQDKDDPEGIVHARMINILSHGNYSLFDPTEMLGENKKAFKRILADFRAKYQFNPDLFPPIEAQQIQEQELIQAAD